MKPAYTVSFAESDDFWLATCPELEVTGAGLTREEALKNLIRSMRVELLARAESLDEQLSSALIH